MSVRVLEADYLVIGAGAMGMAFVDELLLRDANARVVMVDKHAKPGGHWNDAYGFVKLHQPAAFYGVNSEPLGPGGAALVSGIEVLAYFERVLQKWLDSGRLQFFPLCESTGAGRFRSRVEADLEFEVTVRKKTVDATYMKVEVPAIRPPVYAVAPTVTLVPPNALSKLERAWSRYVIIGAGKTGIDAVLFLLDRGVAPEHIHWIMPNDAWLLDRADLAPGHVADQMNQMETVAQADGLEDLLRAFEAKGDLLRLDREVWPTKFRCATVDLEELEKLRSIRNVVRQGRVLRVDPSSIVLEHGSFATDSNTLHIDCTANGLATRPARPVFEGERITLQSVSMCQQVFSASLIGFVETRFDTDDEKNAVSQVVPHPEFSRDFVRAQYVTQRNIEIWLKRFPLWVLRSRLSYLHHDSLFRLLRAAFRQRRFLPRANEKMEGMLERGFPSAAPTSSTPTP